jgi:hypothetical protein
VQYIERVHVWEAEIPHECIIIPKGNAMIQKYYIERLLPVYIDAIHAASLRDPVSLILQEDNDGSYGHRKCGLASELRNANWVTLLKHPVQSPDLNPNGGVLEYSKAQVAQKGVERPRGTKKDRSGRMETNHNEEVRARIAETPER